MNMMEHSVHHYDMTDMIKSKLNMYIFAIYFNIELKITYSFFKQVLLMNMINDCLDPNLFTHHKIITYNKLVLI